MAIKIGWLPISLARTSDVGISYGAVAVLGREERGGARWGQFARAPLPAPVRLRGTPDSPGPWGLLLEPAGDGPAAGVAGSGQIDVDGLARRKRLGCGHEPGDQHRRRGQRKPDGSLGDGHAGISLAGGGGLAGIGKDAEQ